MLCVPIVNAAVLNVAEPPVTLLDPSCVSPSMKVTVPPGVPAGDGIEAVMVTAFDKNAGLGDEVTETMGVAGTTVRVTDPVAKVKSVSSVGVNTAVKVCC